MLRTVGRWSFVAVVGADVLAGGTGDGRRRPPQRSELPGQLAHSLIPIVVGYIFAHYLTYLVERGQQTVLALGRPVRPGLESARLAHLHVAYVLSMHPPVLAAIKVAFVVTGHIAGGDRRARQGAAVLPAGHQLTGQLAMMLVMVGYTFTGLYLLFGG